MRGINFVAVFLLVVAGSAQSKGGLGEIFGSLIGGAAGNVAGKAAVDSQRIESALVKMSEQLNKRMPMTIDKDTRLDNILAGPGRRFTYNYTLVTATLPEIDRGYFVKTFQSNLKNGVCSHPDMQIFFRNGVTVGYSYRANDGGSVGKIDVTPRDCGFAT